MVMVDPAASSVSLLLKSQSPTTAASGAIRVSYLPGSQVVQVWTFDTAHGWAQLGGNVSATLANGDVFGARATSGGLVEAFRNGSLLLSRDAPAWPHASSGGYVGMWLAGASNVFLDTFGGGTIAP
jgi:hypothetical protein